MDIMTKKSPTLLRIGILSKNNFNANETVPHLNSFCCIVFNGILS